MDMEIVKLYKFIYI